MKEDDKEELKGTKLPQPPTPAINITGSTVGNVFISNTFNAAVDARPNSNSGVPVPFEVTNSRLQVPVGTGTNDGNDRIEVSHIINAEKGSDNSPVFE